MKKNVNFFAYIVLSVATILLGVNSILLTLRCGDLESQIKVLEEESSAHTEVRYHDVLDDQLRQDRQIEMLWDTIADAGIPAHWEMSQDN
jgi:hypothetical protein